jgi:putative ABC transport system permease protein
MLVINFYKDSLVQGQAEHIKQELASVPTVTSVSFSSNVPGGSPNNWFVKVQSSTGEMQSANLNTFVIDFDFLKQYDIKMVAGRGFSRDFPTDSTQALIINEAVARSFGYRSSSDAVGKHYSQWGTDGTIIGVVKDFHYQSLQEEIRPLVFKVLDPSYYQMVSLHIAGGNIPQTIAALEQKWKSLSIGHLFEYSFVDEDFNRLYFSQDRFEKTFFYFSILAIFISCLGLLGLAAFSTIQRTKEVGIRKVLGASITTIVFLLSKEFLRLVVIALLIATPTALFIMHRWLQNFAYRTSISWWVFLLAGCVALTIAFLTVGFHSVKAAFANPVKTMRTGN